MYNIPNYKPANNPFLGQRLTKPDPLPVITESTKQAARRQGATFINKDGQTAYKWLYDEMYQCHAPDFAAWEPVTGPDLPAGELEEL